MARIIKPGVRQVREFRGVCPHCKCEFALEPGEVEFPDLGVAPYGACPCCHKHVTGLKEEWVTVSYGPPKPPEPRP